jgi:cytochrome oxidase assembly protein ShyY1
MATTTLLFAAAAAAVGVLLQSALFTPVNDFTHGKILWVDVAGIQQWLGQGLELQSYLIETSSSSSSSSEASQAGTGGPRVWPLARTLTDLQDFYVMPSTHLVYAVTWYVGPLEDS